MVSVVLQRPEDTVLAYTKPALIINAASGSTEDIRDEAVALAKDYGLELRAEYLEPENIEGAVEEIVADSCDLFISYGGDGTSRHSGETAVEHGLPFIPLPGGTMNMLPRLLYGDVAWDHALVQALQAGERWHPRGEMNGHSFFCGGFIGKATRVNEVRECLRDRNLGEALECLRRVSGEIDLDDTMTFGPSDAPEAARANLINIQMPGMSETAPIGSGISLTGVDVDGGLDIVSLGIKALFGGMTGADQTRNFVVREGVVSYDGSPDVLLDGEPIDMTAPLRFRLFDQGIRVLAPTRHDGMTYKDDPI